MKTILALFLALLVSIYPKLDSLPEVAAAAPKLQQAVGSIVKHLLSEDKELSIGMDINKALKAFKGGASMGGEFVLPLRDSPLGPKGKWNGTVSAVMFPEDDEILDSMNVALLCDKYDKGKMGKFIVEVANKYGVKLEQDDEDRTVYYNLRHEDRDLWIGLGDHVIGFNCGIPSD